jgi:hypothetical protein
VPLGPFLSAPLRTGQTRFPRIRLSSLVPLAASGCPHLAALASLAPPLPPFALRPAFPISLVGRDPDDSYGGSVAVGVG